MARTFLGSAASFGINGNDLVNQNLFVIENATYSRVNVIIKRLTTQNDAVTVLTSVMPLIKTSRATSAATGGITLAKVPFDTSQSSDVGVIIRTPIASGSPITATQGNTIWQQYDSRLHTGAEQQRAIDINNLPILVDNLTDDFILVPGELLLVQVVGFTTASNAAITNNWFVQCVCEEEELGTFAISGTVTLSGSPVEGAKVIVLEASDESMNNPHIVDVLTTNVLGQWSSTICSGRVGAAFVQYKSGAIYYTAPGSPFLES